MCTLCNKCYFITRCSSSHTPTLYFSLVEWHHPEYDCPQRGVLQGEPVGTTTWYCCMPSVLSKAHHAM